MLKCGAHVTIDGLCDLARLFSEELPSSFLRISNTYIVVTYVGYPHSHAEQRSRTHTQNTINFFAKIIHTTRYTVDNSHPTTCTYIPHLPNIITHICKKVFHLKQEEKRKRGEKNDEKKSRIDERLTQNTHIETLSTETRHQERLTKKKIGIKDNKKCSSGTYTHTLVTLTTHNSHLRGLTTGELTIARTAIVRVKKKSVKKKGERRTRM